MPAPKPLAALAAAVAIAASAATLGAAGGGALPAPWTEDGLSGFARDAARPPKASAETAKRRTASPSCSRSHYDYSVSFPRSMDGGGPVDKAVAALASDFMVQAREDAGVFMSFTRECGEDSPEASLASYFRVTSSPYAVSGSSYSVLFSVSTMMAGSRGSKGYYAANLSADGTEITLGRLFPDPGGSLTALWESVYGGFCRGHAKTPIIFDSLPCVPPGEPAPPAPDSFVSPGEPLDGTGHALLTSLGLSLHLGDYESYSREEGVQYLDIPKADLLAMGADPAIWK
ncbi:MAG: hypothetical protein LBQ12_02695 [Deltaproteobacteria bacterium]|jgi:hypothetical protein|nr:hypothetical protein [Deltaproteobacteria bacterium]